MLNHRVVVVRGELEKRWRKFIKVGGPFASLHEAWPHPCVEAAVYVLVMSPQESGSLWSLSGI